MDEVDENAAGEPMHIIVSDEETESTSTVSEPDDERRRERGSVGIFGNSLNFSYLVRRRHATALRGGQILLGSRPLELIFRRSANADMDREDSSSVPGSSDAAETLTFDTDLPAEHAYLGNLTRVSGVDYLEPGTYHRLLVFYHHSMVFPGETLPMIIPQYIFDSESYPDNGLLFGIVFNEWKTTRAHIYGVTCQVYEKGNDERGNVSLLSRVHQRFRVSEENNINFSELLRPNIIRKIYADVLILPEILLPDPLMSLHLGSMNRFRDTSMKEKLKDFQTATTVWPKSVYSRYNIESTIERAKKCLSSYKINAMPSDLILLSFWLGQNLIFDTEERVRLFLTNSVNERMILIDKCLDSPSYFCCRICKHQIANCNALFAMSKHGVQSNYCNPAGYIHETSTVYSLVENAVYTSGPPSTQFSWFPGYSWQIILCQQCEAHIGWKFVSKNNFLPKKFFGLSGKSVVAPLTTTPSVAEVVEPNEDQI